MGALHAGHVALICRARRLAGNDGTVVVSIFVNPTQFGPREDFARYPRPFVDDCKICGDAGADAVFAPTAAQIYPLGFSTFVDETTLSQVLCGRSRPGHFRGVCTVVAKLFQIIAPDIAVFGQKDYQQLAIIRRMVRDLDFSVKIVGVETVREPDGLAISSRNKYLTPDERAQAPVIREALLAAARSGISSAAAIKKRAGRAISRAPLARIDYVEVADAVTLDPVATIRRPVVLAAAVFFGQTRLIDNILLK